MEVELEAGTHQVSVNPLHRFILAWDFYRDVTDDRNAKSEDEVALLNWTQTIADQVRRRAEQNRARSAGATTPADSGTEGGSNASSSPASPTRVVKEPAAWALNKLAAVYTSDEDYMRDFMALFLVETKQQIHRAKETEMSAPEVTVLSASEMKTNGLFCVTVQKDEAGTSRYGINDLVLLYLDPPEDFTPQYTASGKENPVAKDIDEVSPEASEAEVSARDKAQRKVDEANVDARPIPPADVDNPHHMLGVVEQVTRDTLKVQALVFDVQPDRPRDLQRMLGCAAAMGQVGSRWYCARVMGLSTVHREYKALMSLPRMALRDHVLLLDLKKAKKSKKKEASKKAAFSWKDGPNDTLEIGPVLMEALNSQFNRSQLEALNECRKVQGITLIQGPPGTGKTTTIVGILSVILNSKYNATKKSGGEVDSLEETVNDHVGACQECRTVSTSEICKTCLTPVRKRLFSDSANNVKKRRCLYARAQPWLYGDYLPWTDSVQVRVESLEDHKSYLKAARVGADEVLDVKTEVDDQSPQRVLVCAPSNAAIDEILKRLVAAPAKGGGIWDEKGDRVTPAVIRIGPNLHRDLELHGLEAKVGRRLQAKGAVTMSERDAIKSAVLKEAKIICSTLSMCGSRDVTSFAEGFDTVVIDEASQGVELSTLIPLSLGCRRLIMVGDPRQLSATVFSRVALDHAYDQSLFQRLELAGYKINMLSVQYRMHPSISAFPSKVFYEGDLKDAEEILDLAKPPINCWYSLPIFRPALFFSLDSKEKREAASMVNPEEADFVCQLVELLGVILMEISGEPETSLGWTQRVAVISPYAEQVRLIRRMLKRVLCLPETSTCPIDVNTVDGFQGREKDLVIFSAVRAQYTGPQISKSANIGFLADVRRLNVALTRARLNLWIVGNAGHLAGNPQWKKLIGHMESAEAIFDIHYKKHARDGFLKRWLADYFKRVSARREEFHQAVPGFVTGIERDARILSMADKPKSSQTE